MNRLLYGIAVIATVLLLPACSDDEPPTVDPSKVTRENNKFHEVIEIDDTGFKPANARVLVGGSVTFVNRARNGNLPKNYHSAKSDGLFEPTDANDEQTAFDTHTLTWNEPYTVTLTHYGTYEYVCTFDPNMKGTIAVDTRSPGIF